MTVKAVRPRKPCTLAQLAAGARNLAAWRAAQTPLAPERRRLFKKLRAAGVAYEPAWRAAYGP